MGSEWRSTTVGEIFDLVNGYAFKSKEFVSTGVPVIKIKNVKAGFFSEHAFSYVDARFLKTREEKIAKRGDLLISMSGNRHDGTPGTWVGKVAYFDKARPYLINQRVGALRLKPSSEADARFMGYLLSSWDFQRLFISIATSSGGQANISPKQILEAPLMAPDRDTQRRIAHILGSLDDKIELNRRTNRTLEGMAAAIFKSWFIDFDPLHAKAEGRDPGLPQQIADLFPDSFQDSPLGAIPEGWEVGTLSDVAENPRRSIKPEDVPPATPYIGLQDMPRRCIALDTWGRADEVSSQKSRFNTGEILFGKLRPYFHKVGVAPVDGVCSTDIVVVVPKAEHWRSYVLCLVSSKKFVDYTDSHSAGTKMPRTNWKDMIRYPMAVPPVDLAQAFQDHVASFHSRIPVSIRQNRQLALLRDAILPKLLSSEIDESLLEQVEVA